MDEETPLLGNYKNGGLLAGWADSLTGPYHLAELDASGHVVGTPETIPAAFNAFRDTKGFDGTHHEDLFTYPDGSVGWAYIAPGPATRKGTSAPVLKLARVNGACP